jgi:hypothetical protein
MNKRTLCCLSLSLLITLFGVTESSAVTFIWVSDELITGNDMDETGDWQSATYYHTIDSASFTIADDDFVPGYWIDPSLISLSIDYLDLSTPWTPSSFLYFDNNNFWLYAYAHVEPYTDGFSTPPVQWREFSPDTITWLGVSAIGFMGGPVDDTGHWEIVPEPCSFLLFGSALVGFAGRRRRFQEN